MSDVASSYGRYQLLRKLAVGGMAEVFLARQRGIAGFEKVLVIKRILPELAQEPEFVTMFLDEARLAASMSHPNIVQIFDLGQIEDTFFLAMEYVSGPDLRIIQRDHAKKQARMPFELSARIIAGVADALAYAHDHKDPSGKPLKLVHRDVTPSNILVAYSGAVKLVDFGIAKAETQSQKTAAGRVKGKARYLSPEQLQSKPLDGRSDVWAAGVCLYELATGTRPFKGENEMALMKAILDVEIPQPRAVAPDVPEALERIIMSCMERDVEKRMPSAAELRNQLELWLKSATGPSSTADLSAYVKTFFAAEASAAEELLKEIAELDSPSQSGLRKLNAMGLDVTPSRSSRRLPSPASAPASSTEATQAAVAAPAQRSRTGLVIGGVVLALVVAAIAAVALRPSAPVVGTVVVRSDPAGATVTIDEKAITAKTPTQLRDLALGPHFVRLTLDGYDPQTATIVLTPDRNSEAIAVVLQKQPALPAKLSLHIEPAAERLFLDGARMSTTGADVELEVTADAQHTVLAERDGYQTGSVAVTLKPGESRAVTVTLEPKPEEPKAAPTVASETGRGGGKKMGLVDLVTDPPAEVSVRGLSLGKTPLNGVKVPLGDVPFFFVNDALMLRQTVRIRVTPDVQKKSIVFRKGKLAVDVEPWADVYLGSKKLGTTPFQPKEMYEGTYVLRLVNSEIGALQNVTVTVKPGETAVLRYDLSQR